MRAASKARSGATLAGVATGFQSAASRDCFAAHGLRDFSVEFAGDVAVRELGKQRHMERRDGEMLGFGSTQSILQHGQRELENIREVSAVCVCDAVAARWQGAWPRATSTDGAACTSSRGAVPRPAGLAAAIAAYVSAASAWSSAKSGHGRRPAGLGRARSSRPHGPAARKATGCRGWCCSLRRPMKPRPRAGFGCRFSAGISDEGAAAAAAARKCATSIPCPGA